MNDQLPTMLDLYPGDRGWHRAHGEYISAVAAAFTAAGVQVENWSAEANAPRDGFVALDRGQPGIETEDPVDVVWSENHGWSIITGAPAPGAPGAFTNELRIDRVAAPATVLTVVLDKIATHDFLAAYELSPLADIEHPDADFPLHTHDIDDVPFELALRHYAGPA